MAEFLTFQLRGDMASWGDIAVGEQRPTLPFPTKSAILGLLAAALGIDREADEHHRELTASIRYGVKIFSNPLLNNRRSTERFSGHSAVGGFLRDYQTVQSASVSDVRQFSKKFNRRPASRYDEIQAMKIGGTGGAILSFRDYWLDVFYVVAIESVSASQFSIQALKSALLEPKFHLYLGRKACPLSLPLDPSITEANTIKEALNQFECKNEFCPQYSDSSFYVEWQASDNVETSQIEEYRAVPRSRSKWQFDTHRMVHSDL
ncbi:type I-E CRISPR-associated protein Cas5/CasD [bacterium]|nr:type I-E CRISPR-associated protein Cas5/CasD [bacterium]